MSTTINEMQRRIGDVNIANGWRQADEMPDVDTYVTRLALINTEIAEAIEEIRNGHAVAETYYPCAADTTGAPNKPEGVPSELADVVIRVLDTADAWGTDLEPHVANALELDGPITLPVIVDYIDALVTEERDTITAQGAAPQSAIASLAVLFLATTEALTATYAERRWRADEALAGVLVGVALIARAWGIDLEAIVDEKLAYNATRGHRHGGKTA